MYSNYVVIKLNHYITHINYHCRKESSSIIIISKKSEINNIYIYTMHMHTCTHTHTYIHTHTRTHMYTHTHTYTDTHTHTQNVWTTSTVF